MVPKVCVRHVVDSLNRTRDTRVREWEHPYRNTQYKHAGALACVGYSSCLNLKQVIFSKSTVYEYYTPLIF